MVIKATKLFNLYTLLSKRKRTIKKSIRCVYKGITKKKIKSTLLNTKLVYVL